MRRISSLSFLFLMAVVATAAGGVARGADGPPTKAADKKSGKKDSAKSAKPVLSDEDEWKRLMARKKEIMKEIESLSAQAQSADMAARQKLVPRFQQLQAEFQTDLQPGILKLAPKMYEKDATNPEAAEVMVIKALDAGDDAGVVTMVDKVVAADTVTAPLMTYKGVALFNSGEFEAAQKALEKSRDLDKKIFPQFAGPFLEMSVKYADYWKDEQALREKEKAANDLPRVLLKTNRGNIELELYENEAPNTVANFISLVEAGKYDGTLFHRVIPGFMAQGGDPNSLDDDPNNDGKGGPGYTIACECYSEKARKHFVGSLSMAHGGRDSGGSQFFLTHRTTAHLDYAEGKTEGNHTVFGRIVKGFDVAVSLKVGDKIEKATVLRKRKHEYVPETLTERRNRTSKSGSKPKTRNVAE